MYYLSYAQSQLKLLVTMIMEFFKNPKGHYSAIFQKYINHKYKYALTYVKNVIDKGFTLPLT